MKTHRVTKLLSFFNTIISFFSSSRHRQKLLLHHIVVKTTSEINRIYVLLMFLALVLCIGTIFLSGFSKQSSDDEDSNCHPNHFLSILELYPLFHKVDEDILDETYSLADIMAEDEQEFIPLLNKVDEEKLNKTYSLANIMVKDKQEFTPLLNKVDEEKIDKTYSLANIETEDEQEFTPRLVHLELIEGATGSHDDYTSVIPDIIQVKLIEGATEINDKIEQFHGYNEDNDDKGDDDDHDEDDDLNVRINEFIANNIRRWREEMLIDKYAYLEY